jgi:TonB family protein
MWTLTPLRACSRVLVTAALMLGSAASPLVVAQTPTPPPAAQPAKPVQPAQPAPPAAPAAAKPADLHVKITTLEEWDNAVDSLTNLTALVYNTPSSQDLGGHDVAYYWQQYILTPPTKEKLETLRDKAQKQSVAKDTAGLQKSLDEASTIITNERAKAFTISTFINAQGPVIYHQYQLGPWLIRATDADRASVNDRVAATYARLLQEFDAVVKLPQPDTQAATTQRFFKLIADAVTFFNAERARLVAAQADQPNPVPVSARTRGSKPCPAPVPPMKGRDRPALAPDFPSSEAFYPAGAKQNDVQGSVTVRAEISETGCIQKAEVKGTSGVAWLDESALELAMAGSYVPAAGPGDKPKEGILLFRVKFEQPDAFGSTP